MSHSHTPHLPIVTASHNITKCHTATHHNFQLLQPAITSLNVTQPHTAPSNCYSLHNITKCHTATHRNFQSLHPAIITLNVTLPLKVPTGLSVIRHKYISHCPTVSKILVMILLRCLFHSSLQIIPQDFLLFLRLSFFRHYRWNPSNLCFLSGGT